ncbi:MAG: YqgE/AlgH family protein [Ferruginibacter sp.]
MIAPAEGILLIAEPFLKDPSFARSVVLICRHTAEEGTFGFSLHQQSAATLDEIIPGMEGIEIPVFRGGPVQTDTLHYLHQYPEFFPDAVRIAEGIYWGGEFEILKQLIKDETIDPGKIKFFLGYSGWSAGQLDEEMKENTWLTVPSDSGMIFDIPNDEIWNASLNRLGGKYKMLIHYPTDPQLN